MDGILRLSPIEKIHVTVIVSNGRERGWTVRPDQKSIGWTEDRVDRSSGPRKLEVDLSFSTFVTVRSCLELTRLRHFLGFEVDAKSYAVTTEVLVETIVRQVLKEKSDISGSDDAIYARKKIVRALDGMRARKRMRSRKIPEGFCPGQMFSSHVPHFLLNIFLNLHFFDKERQIP